MEGRFLGRRGEEGELVLGLLLPLLGGLGPLLGKSMYWRGSDGSGRPPGISSTTGGNSARGMREVAAASGSSTPTSNLTSGRASRGGV